MQFQYLYREKQNKQGTAVLSCDASRESTDDAPTISKERSPPFENHTVDDWNKQSQPRESILSADESCLKRENLIVTSSADVTVRDSMWVQERTAAIHQICDDVEDIHHTMNMLQLLVEEQGPLFECIEGRIATVANRTEQGTQQLVAANRAQVIRRRRLPRNLAVALLVLSGSAIAGTGIGAAVGSAMVGAGATLALSSGSVAILALKD